MTTNKIFCGAAVICMMMLGIVEANADNMSTSDFVKQAAVSNEFEIASSKLALSKSQNPAVKDFAQMMIKDHGMAGDTLKATVKSVDPTLMPPAKLDEAKQSMLNELGAKSGADFDGSYIAMQEKAHKEAVALFMSYSQYGDNAAIKKFASDTLPTLRMHEKHVNEIKL